ncbi:MAG: hypothetical protein OXH70_13430 [Acidobacteria bacterium]|nr:hypothetical protein [Acidobacteriota bacterium]
MAEVKSPGLSAHWLNGWLAAVGATVLVPGMRLRWTEDQTPVAVLSADHGNPVELISRAWPDRRRLAALPIAEEWCEERKMQRKVPLDRFTARARATRGNPQSWALSATMTDLEVDQQGEVAHGPFDAAGPGTIKWLHHRLMRLHGSVDSTTERIDASLAGRADRVSNSGLAFDQTRLGSMADSTGTHLVDPAIEILGFFGLAIFPTRGKGIDSRAVRGARPFAIQRGWSHVTGNAGRSRLCFRWPAWSQSLDALGIDALLDVWKPQKPKTWKRLGVRAGWQGVRFRRRGQADRTAAIASERL